MSEPQNELPYIYADNAATTPLHPEAPAAMMPYLTTQFGNPHSEKRLPSIASLACKSVDGKLLVVLLDRAGVAAATGSACSTGSTEPSHVAQALGIKDPAWQRGTLRLSLSDEVTNADIDALCERVPAAILRARKLSGVGIHL